MGKLVRGAEVEAGPGEKVGKKRVLFFVPPSFYLVTGYKIKSHSHRFMGEGPKLLASSLNPEKFDVDLYDFDAKLMRNFVGIETIVEEIADLYRPREFFRYLRGETTNSKAEEIVSFLTAGLTGYDYILCSNPKYPSYEIPLVSGNHFTLLLMRALSEMNPGAERIMGGRRSHYFEFEEMRKEGIPPEQFVDLLVNSQIPYQSLNDILLERKVPVPPFEMYESRVGRYQSVPFLGKVASPPLDYSIPRETLRNREDLKYTYQQIFDELMLPLPDPQKRSSYIQQAGFHYIGGCISKCAFCATGVSPPSFDSFERLTACIDSYVNELGYNAFFFKNATLNSNRRLVEKFCNWIVQRGLRIYWSDSCRLSGNGPDFYKMLYAAGCRHLCYGMDSGSDRILKYVNKNSTVGEMARELSYAHEAGIWNLVNFIGGYPTETLEEMDETIKFLHDHLQYINTFIFNVFHMEKSSHFTLYPEKFGLEILSQVTAEDMFKDCFVDREPRFREVGGRSWDEIQVFRKQVREKIRGTYALREKKFMTYIGQHLLFALYDMLGTKENVEQWLAKNYRLGRKAYYKKWGDRKKIETWESPLALYPNFETPDSEDFVFLGLVDAAGHVKLGDFV